VTIYVMYREAGDMTSDAMQNWKKRHLASTPLSCLHVRRKR